MSIERLTLAKIYQEKGNETLTLLGFLPYNTLNWYLEAELNEVE